MITEILTSGLLFISPIIPQNEPPDFRSVECLAKNMYFEARNQGSAGLLAVTAVVLNRVKDSRFPNTVCEVIEQGPTRESWKTKKHKILPVGKRKYYPIRHRCQFSWYCDGLSDNPKDKKIYNIYLKISKSILSKQPFIDITDGALFYHADYVTPEWAKSRTRTCEIGDHIFYRWDTK